MNAVKRCLALIAATVLVGACSGDPTADLAGANLTIRATPGALWIIPNYSQTVLLEAIDATGAPAPGNWTATASGVATVVADTTFEHTSSGHVGQGRQYFISAATEGNGSVTFTGTGGTITIPVRVAPSTATFHATVSDLNPALAATFDVTAPAGLRFTSGTAVTVVAGGNNAASNGLATPTVVSMNADSTVMTVQPAPSAAGRLKITGIASVQTPTLTSTSITVDSITVPPLTMAAVFSNAAPALGTQITITAPANFKFRPNSAPTSSGNTFNAPQYVMVGISADSTVMTVIPTSNVNGAVTVSNMQWAPLASLNLPVPSVASLTTAAASDQGADDFFGAGGVAAIGHWTADGTLNSPKAFFDIGTFTAPDNVGDGGPGEQDLLLTYPTAGKYKIDLTWNSGADVDLSLLDAAYGTYFGGSYNAAGVNETFQHTATAGEQNVIAISQFAGTPPTVVRVTVTRIQ